ncbi:MAG: sigma-70 family RNA polymerase sigma factor, partial [Planctomycetales bacterium]|nr:sigma-70 family RNA polymerase sigma factor [Planctomycetales bacterium]
DHFRRVGRRIDVPAGGTDAWGRIADLPDKCGDWPTDGSRPRSAPGEQGLTDEGRGDERRRGGRDRDDGSMDEGPINENIEATWDTLRHRSRDSALFVDVIASIKSQVSPRDWRLFWRTAVDGQTAPEVGLEFGVTANTVRLVKMRVLRKLRLALSTHSPAQSGDSLGTGNVLKSSDDSHG